VPHCATNASNRVLEAGLSAGCTAVVIVWRPSLPVLVSAFLVFVAAVLAMDLARREHHAPSPVAPIACVIVALFVVAVASAPHYPTDIGSYAADGRMIAHYHENPYAVPPTAFSNDPLFSHIATSTAPYGPLFVGSTAVVAEIAGADALGYRLAYQAAAALAIGAALVLLWRARRSTAAIVLVGLHPVVAGTIVNAGHNDAYVALALLAAVLTAERRRFVAAGSVVAVAMLIKLTAGLALVPLVVWAAARGGRSVVLRILAPTALVVVPVTFAVPGMLHSIRSANLGWVTRTSVWNIYPFRAPLLPRFGDGAVTQLGLVAIAVAVFVVSRIKRDLSDRVAGALTAWLVLSAYVMPWYTVWALPVAALHPRSPLTRLVAWQGAVVASAFLVTRSMLGNWPLSFAFGWIAPLILLVAFVAAVRTRQQDESKVAATAAGTAAGGWLSVR
jgi:alpha-1,6-mannosyltransferase